VLLIPYDAIEGSAPPIEIGWRLIRAAWGRGYAAEAAVAVLRHGLDTVGLERVVADIDPDNTRSIRVADKIGLRFVGDDRVKGRPVKRYTMDRET